MRSDGDLYWGIYSPGPEGFQTEKVRHHRQKTLALFHTLLSLNITRAHSSALADSERTTTTNMGCKTKYGFIRASL